MNIGILPNVNSIKLIRDAKQGTSACSRATSASSQKLPKLRAGIAQKQQETESIIHKNGDAFTADHKVVNEENEPRLQHRYADVVQNLLFLLDTRLDEKQSCARNSEMFANIRAARSKNLVSFTQIILWSLFALVKTCVAEDTVRRVNEGTSALLWFIRVFQKSGGEKDCNAFDICETYKTV